MRIGLRRLIAAGCGALGIGVGTLAFAVPGAAACALVHARNFEALPDGTLVEPGASAQERAGFLELLSAAKARIETTFGAPRAAPIVVFLQDARSFRPLALNAHGSTNFLGTRACVFVGPKGRNPDVVSHELMHAELFERVGAWRRFTEIPVWFDEGVAMQVDFRPRYDLPAGEAVDTVYVRQLHGVRSFFGADERRLVRNYAAAKVEVAHGLSGIGAPGLYGRLGRIREGEPFDMVFGR